MQSLPPHLVVGLAALCAAALTFVGSALGPALGFHLRSRVVAAVFATLFFLALTQLPLPDAALLKPLCPRLAAQPNWVPFYTAIQIAREWRMNVIDTNDIPLPLLSYGSGMVEAWLRYRSFKTFLQASLAVPALLNLLVCIPIGALLFPFVRFLTLVTAAFALSLAVELTQITGTWGLYPCAYRKFDVDDLILNTLGAVLGFMAARRLA